MGRKEEKTALGAGVKSFITAIIVIFIMMIVTYALTFIIPGGGIPFWKWALSPILVLFSEDNSSMIAVIILLIVLGGLFNTLDKFGVLRFLLDKITDKFGKSRRILLAVIPLFFMVLGSAIGTFEECVPLVPIVVALAIRLGWDALTGLGMSILAAGCGFAAGVCNPFTVGVAQEIAGLRTFSGIWLRIVGFVLIYGLLMLFLWWHVKKIEKPMDAVIAGGETKKEKASEIQRSAGSKILKIVLTFKDGVISVLPGVLLIMMANSIRYTLMEGNILDAFLAGAIELVAGLPRWGVILFIYALVLVMNFFIPSGSAKAFLLMPLIVPTAEVFGISSQLCVLAFAFGDGFSNVFYPTNPVLLISLGLANISYGNWVKWSGKFQLANLILTSVILLFGLAVGYC
ncbi:MAG: TIGR00366 family protein [Lachnospiraceae bacterium]|nr:TIGR00366 family protein [Lachnospiraceae bacterium]